MAVEAGSAGPFRARLRCPGCEEPVSVALIAGKTEASCPSCAASIPVGRPLPLDPSDFEASVRKAEIPVLVVFSAEWCAPCKWLDPYLDEVVGRSAGRLLAFKVDVDQATDLVRRYAIASVPAVLLFRSGDEKARSLGVEPERLREMASGAW